MSFNDFVKNYNLKIKATSNIKLQQVLGSIGLDNVGIYSRHGPFKIDIGIVNSHPKRTHSVSFINENYFDSYGFVSPKRLCKFFKNRNGYCLFSEYQIQKNDSFCAMFCLYIIYLTKVLRVDFKSAFLKLYYQLIY